MTTWLEDASANRHIKTYVKDFLDLSGNFTVRNNYEDYKWNSYGQVLSGVYESDNNVHFGITLDMDASGTTIIVGAHRDNIQGSDDGAAYVYRYDTTAEIWYQLGNTLFENGTTDFGVMTSISDDGSRVAVGDDGVNHIYFYDYNSSTNTWDSAGSITNSIYLDELNGIRLSGDGNTIIFGDLRYNNDTGIANVKRNTSGTTWTTIGTFTGTNSGDIAGQGLSISYNGNRISFGEKDYDTDSNGNTSVMSGRVAIYDYPGNGTTWNQVGDWIYGNLAGGRFPRSAKMSLDGSKIVFGAEYNNRVMVYEYDATVTGSWKQLGSTIFGSYGATSNSGQFGRAVNMSADGTIIAVGEHSNDDIGTDRGAIYIYKYINGDWEQQGETLYGPINTGESMGYYHGVGLSADGTKVIGSIVNADLNTTESGGVVAWQWSTKSYGPLIDISGETIIFGKDVHKDDPNYYKVVEDGMNSAVYSVTNELYGGTNTDYFGSSIAMNEDGSRMIVGAALGDESATDDGYAMILEWNNGRWGQIGNIISPSSRNYYRSGATVDMNDTGEIVLLGSLYESTGTSQNGSISAYEYINGDWSLKGSIINGSSGKFGHEGCAMNGTGNVIAGIDIVGNVKVYQYVEANSDWSQLGSTISVSSGEFNSGYAATKRIDLNQDGTIIVVGDVNDDTTGTNNGRLSVYKFTGDVTDGSWNLIGNHITITTSSSFPQDDNFGREVSINSDGTIVGGTSMYYNSEEGRAFIYKYSEDAGDWAQLGTDIGRVQMVDSTTNYNARSIALSGDGKTVTIGDSHDSTLYGYGGAVNVFKYANGNWVWVGKIYGSQENALLEVLWRMIQVEQTQVW